MLDLNTILFNNTLEQYLYALGAFIALVILSKGFLMYFLRKFKRIAEKTETDVDDALIDIIKSLKPPFYYFVAFYVATFSLKTSEFFGKVSEGILLILIVYQVISVSQILVDYILSKNIDESDGLDEEELSKKTTLQNISKIVKFVLWAIGILLILSNLGIDITSLVAGLGVGGIAIAFAMQNILADLFSSFAIYFDKPFKVGDFIALGTDKGTVEKIGIKTTRLKTPQGEELIVSNQELTSARIQNFKRMEERRAVFQIGVTYDTSKELVKEIPLMIKTIIESVEGVRFDRAHFKQFGDSALNFEIVFFMKDSEYVLYMDAQQEINLKIMAKFEEKGIEMAFPTQTVFVKNV